MTQKGTSASGNFLKKYYPGVNILLQFSLDFTGRSRYPIRRALAQMHGQEV